MSETDTQSVDERRPSYEELVAKNAALTEELAALRALVERLNRQLFGKKSEKTRGKMPPVEKELRDRGELQTDPDSAKKKRKKNKKTREALPTEEVPHTVPEDAKTCPACGSTELKHLGEGKRTTEYEYIPGYFVRRIHIQQTLACSCGEYVVTAPAPQRVTEGGVYGPGLHAHIVTAKCTDSIPLHRIEKQFERQGIPIARATLVKLFHQAANLLEPLSARLLALVAESELVQADETPIKMQDGKRGYLWTFLSDDVIAYRYTASRSGATPQQVLGGGSGVLVVDGYTGYNRVFTPDGWTRAGCLAHARRKFFDARSTCPEAEQAMTAIREIYRVEHDARSLGVVRTDEHARLRETRSRPLVERFKEWLEEQQGLHPPKSAMGNAVNYALNNWAAITYFLEAVSVPLDNNASENALRVAALGRKNFLFVGHEQAGENLAGLYSLTATCKAQGVKPEPWLADILLRIQTHPHDRIDELLPRAWAEQFGGDEAWIS
jgi:transposase